MSLLSLLFPGRCLECGRFGQYFCPDCKKAIKVQENQICPVCRRQAIFGQTHFRCRRKTRPEGLTSVFAYRGIIKQAIQKLKYRRLTDLVEELIGLTMPELEPHLKLKFFLSDLVLVPVPLYPLRYRRRGFNQAELLGKELAKKLNWGFEPDALRRVKFTQPQAKLKGQERQANVKDAFEFGSMSSGFSLPATNFVIFDDVWTTGSTVKECVRVLKKAGAKKVWGLTLAR